MTDRVGQQLGNYRLIRLLGEGGFAHVYLGEHIHLHTHAAIKLLHVQVAGTDKNSFLTEAQTIARLDHPNIVRVLDFDVQDGVPFLVMSYAPKGTLRHRHPKGTQLPLSTIVAYIKQAADALQYAHERKIVHRDVKPENMLVGRRDELLLSDFGIALITQSSISESVKDTVGTVAYMAPEQIRGKPRSASDQYSLAVVVYEWICGQRPFSGSFTELCTQHMFAEPPSLREQVPTLPADVESVIMTALSKDPKQRFASVEAFARAFRQASQPYITRTLPEITSKLQRDHVLPVSSPDLDVGAQANGSEAQSAKQDTTPDYNTQLIDPHDNLPGQAIMPVGSGAVLSTTRGRKRPLVSLALLAALVLLIGGLSFYAYPTISTYITTNTTHVQATTAASRATATAQASINAYGKYVTQNGNMYGFDAQRTNNNPYERILGVGNVARLHLKWKTQPVNDSLFSPTVVNGSVYLSTHFGSVYAFDAGSGRPKWAKPAHIDKGSIIASPTVVGGVVYVSGLEGTMDAFNADTGELEWSASVGVLHDSPLVMNGVLYVGSDDKHLYAFDAVSGKLLWKAATGDSITNNPAFANGIVYASADDNKLYAFDATSGQKKWSDPIQDAPASDAQAFHGISPPVVANGVVYLATHDGRLYAFDAASGKQKWFVTAFNGLASELAVAGDNLYISSTDHSKIYAFDARNGHLKWSAVTNGPVNYYPPAVANGVVYASVLGDVASNTPEKIYAFNAINGQKLWSSPESISLDGIPVIANGVVYSVSSDIDGTLYAFS